MSEKIIERTYFEVIYRFFEPVKKLKIYSIQQMIKWITGWINPFIHVMFIEKIVTQIELWSRAWFEQFLIYYISYVLLFEIFHWCTYYWWWFSADPEIRKNLSNEYIEKYMNFDNSYIEKIGTGKSISILNKWIDAWASGLTRFLWNWAGLVASFILVFFYLLKIHYTASIVFIFVFIFALYFSHLMNSRTIRIRMKRN